MIDQRIIPDVTEPHPGYTNAQLRERVRTLRGMNHELVDALERAAAFVEAAYDEHSELIEHYQNGGSPVDPEYKQSVDGILALFRDLSGTVEKAKELAA